MWARGFMRKQHKSFGVWAFILALPNVLTSCQTTSTQVYEETMMHERALSENQAHGCPCGGQGVDCSCHKNECLGSCGGEGLDMDSDEHACGGE